MHLDDFMGRGAPVRGLCEAYAAGAPVHAALLLGPAGIGKRTLAGLLAQSLYCRAETPKPCGQCPPCRRFLAGSHPDAYRIPEAKRIGVEEIRTLIGALSTAAYEGGWRTIVIECAGAMTTQAQNSLLKTLEEPPPNTVFLLTATSGTQLLATILSRCRIVQVPPYPEAEVERILRGRGLAPARAAQLAAMAQGSVGEALSMDGDESFWALRTRLYEAMDSVRSPVDVLPAVNLLKDDKASAERVCGLLEAGLREAMLRQLQVLSTAPDGGWPQALAQMDARRLSGQLTAVLALRQRLASNVTWQAALERFLLDYAEDK